MICNAAGCTLFQGEWILDNEGPAYTNETCHFIEPYQNCMRNERPDTGYLYWRWKPKNCDLARFDADKFLNAMRNKSWALIGDSIFRNHMQSLICLLSKVCTTVTFKSFDLLLILHFYFHLIHRDTRNFYT